MTKARAYLCRAAVRALRVPNALSLTIEGVTVSLEGDAFTIDDEQGAIPLGRSECDISRNVDDRSRSEAAQVEWLAGGNSLEGVCKLVRYCSTVERLTNELTTGAGTERWLADLGRLKPLDAYRRSSIWMQQQ